MDKSWLQRWEDRYRDPQFAFGKEPNDFLCQQLPQLAPGRILLPADGEGRNGVYAAGLGWQVYSFDISSEGQKKALQLAAEKQVVIDFQVGEFSALSYAPASFDAMALIYAHFPAAIRAELHRQLAAALRPGGHLILEAFSKNHLQYVDRNPRVGGPRELPMLFSAEELRQEFPDFEFLRLSEEILTLREGIYHDGEGAVLRLLARKN
ncbi:MAG: class I SAM-dependent methyltransferase [Leptospirales bacterium]|nr:class I SAM-dependent methyltransferase [Leptospirales bacterium]